MTVTRADMEAILRKRYGNDIVITWHKNGFKSDNSLMVTITKKGSSLIA